ncbi:hypothetical protein E4U55_002026 [Claviceps digitariae]|nr:hypothetical protein E4U55_002026 [Claviceps digitariae]
MTPPPDHDNRNIHQLFQEAPFSAHPETWSALYRDSFHPWDRQGPSLALADLLAQRPDLVPPAQDHDQRGNLLRDPAGRVARRTALVPGCGRGHDVLLLSSFGYDVVGLDCSPEAVRLAEENQDRQSAADENSALYGPPYGPVEGLEKGRVSWVVGDFFDDAWAEGRQFDLIFDYSFLCALPPSERPAWSSRITQLLHPSGHLICLEFPSGKPLSDGGPPWGLTPEVYEALLGAPGMPVLYREDGSGRPLDDVSAKPHPGALHRLSLMKPARTHGMAVAEGDNERHMISVWTR